MHAGCRQGPQILGLIEEWRQELDEGLVPRLLPAPGYVQISNPGVVRLHGTSGRAVGARYAKYRTLMASMATAMKIMTPPIMPT